MSEPKKGENKGNAGKGRPKGSPNKHTALLKDAILQAAEEAGDGNMVTYLKKQADANPTAFLSLLGKVLPMQITGDLAVTVTTKEQRDAAVAAATRADR
jgi:hypothetical protein